MATRYVTLKDSNGDTIYPQSVIAQVANGEITTDLIADGAVTGGKVSWSATVNEAMLTFQPTEVTNGKDLNTTEFLGVGNYYCSTANAGSISNCPTGGKAFKMEVTTYGPSINDAATTPWVIRYRVITDYYGTMYIQQVNAGATPGSLTYGPWNRICRTYRKGESIYLYSERIYVPGRQRVVSGTKTIEASIVLDGMIGSDVTSITFSPSSYNEAFGPNGLLYSFNNPTTSQLTYSCSKGPDSQANTLRMTITVLASTSTTMVGNSMCLVKPCGTLTFS